MEWERRSSRRSPARGGRPGCPSRRRRTGPGCRHLREHDVAAVPVAVTDHVGTGADRGGGGGAGSEVVEPGVAVRGLREVEVRVVGCGPGARSRTAPMPVRRPAAGRRRRRAAIRPVGRARRPEPPDLRLPGVTPPPAGSSVSTTTVRSSTVAGPCRGRGRGSRPRTAAAGRLPPPPDGPCPPPDGGPSPQPAARRSDGSRRRRRSVRT
jgi:hypothetical protein